MSTWLDMHATPVEPVVPANRCSCGCAEPHKFARRETSDGYRIDLWTDGSITHGLNIYLRWLGPVRSRWARGARASALRLMADDIPLYEAAEIPALIKLAAKTFAWRWKDVDHVRAWVRSTFASRGGK